MRIADNENCCNNTTQNIVKLKANMLLRKTYDRAI